VNIESIVEIICGSSFFLALLWGRVLGWLGKKRFRMICKLYEQRFGTLPHAVRVFRKAYGPWTRIRKKMVFFYRPLIFNKIIKDMFGGKGADGREFILGLPEYVRYWFILVFYKPMLFNKVSEEIFGRKGMNARGLIRSMPRLVRYWFILESYLGLALLMITFLSACALHVFDRLKPY
jgi:hypothetical protein